MAKRQWLRANCPICGEQYQHLNDYKPSTCGKFSCIQAELFRKLALEQKPDPAGMVLLYHRVKGGKEDKHATA